MMRTRLSLNGTWRLQPDGTQSWLDIAVPSAWELMLGAGFDGVCRYRRDFVRPEVPPGHRVWLHFEAVATHTQVWLNDCELGGHSGDWTPFEFDITDLLRSDNSIILRVEEDRDHVTRGFTCMEMPHHGGIWQDVYLEIRPADRIIEPICIWSDLAAGEVFVAAHSTARGQIEVAILPLDSDDVIAQTRVEHDTVSLPASELKRWTPDSPRLYRVRARLTENGEVLDEVTDRFGYREIRTEGNRLLLNGKPIYPRGWLTWGVYPEIIAPAPTPEQIRAEFEHLKRLGFNMAKLCLWMPPRHYFDIADEMGILLWIEYPTWQTGHLIGPANYPEWDELFLRDRNHPSAILRSLTCESKGIDEDALKHVFSRAHELIPGSVVADNSGFFLSWSDSHKDMRTDFYSDHPYLDCHVFPQYLQTLADRLGQVPEKPLITGESMDCDTYRRLTDYRAAYPGELPFWLNWGEPKPAPGLRVTLPEMERRERQSQDELGLDYAADLVELSYKHALAHIKYQVSEYRKRSEFTGYTLIGVRDAPTNPMGFHDDFGNLKYKSDQVLLWNNDTVLLIETHRPDFNFRSDEQPTIDILASCFDPDAPTHGTLEWTVMRAGAVEQQGSVDVELKPADVKTLHALAVEAQPSARSPQVVEVSARLTVGSRLITNDWRLYIFPPALFPDGTIIALGDAADSYSPSTERLLITDRLTNNIIDWLGSGGRALLVVPPSGVLPTEPSCFWREAVEVFVRPEVLGDFPHERFVDLQFLPLTSNHKLVSEKLTGKADVLLRRINPRYFGYGDDLVQMRVGDGVVLACTLNLLGDGNFTGAYLLSQLAHHALGCRPTRGMTSTELAILVDSTRQA